VLHACSSREHQQEHWGAGHRMLCKKLALGIAAGLHAGNNSPAIDGKLGEDEGSPVQQSSLVPSRFGHCSGCLAEGDNHRRCLD
jgi:hypothetical protein